MGRKKSKKTVEKIDGLNAKDIANIRKAIRQVWHRSHVRKLCVQRCIGKDGFSYCEKCKKRSPKVFIDHKIAVGDVDAGFIKRLFISSKGLQGLCKKCHDTKTSAERKQLKRDREAALGFY